MECTKQTNQKKRENNYTEQLTTQKGENLQR